MKAPSTNPTRTSAARTSSERTAAVAFSQVRPKAPIAGERMNAANASSVTSPAPMNSQTCVLKLASGSAIALILAQAPDEQGDGGGSGERRRPESPAAEDVGHEMSPQIDPGEPDHEGDAEPDRQRDRPRRRAK